MRPLLKTAVFSTLVPGTAVGWIPYYLLKTSHTPILVSGWRFLGFIPFLVGLTVLLWCMWDFATKGLGTPAPIDPPKKLVVQGLYRYVRNPMYGGILLILLGENILFAFSPLIGYTFGAFLFFNLFIFLHEEPTLRKKFGRSYIRYYKKVPRWIPKTI